MRASLAALATVIIVLLLVSMRSGAQGLQDIQLSTGAANSPVVAELFTSQSCSSCPPAEKLFAELAERPDLIVLEWHVDYWDRLVHGRAGSWKDPYSDPDHTARQRQYNRTLRDTAGVYTPQAVINGRLETVGSRSSEVSRLLDEASHATAKLEIDRDGDSAIVAISAFETPLEQAADIYRLTLLPQQTTAVPRGENRGAVLSSRNVVIAAERVGTYTGDATALGIRAPEAGESCAVIIQEKRGGRLGPILGASYC
ncbi:MAG: DUF1223 domain-containing protein [Pseudomonadota bacterium]